MAGKWKICVIAALALGGGIWLWRSIPGGASAGERPKYRVAEVVRKDIVKTVDATGTVTPRNSAAGIPVGAQVNGRIMKLFVDYNSHVTNGQVVALIDPLVYDAAYRSALAELHANEALVKKCEAELVLAEKTLARKRELAKREMASVADLDAAIASRDTAAASLDQARANVERSEASVTQTRANLGYCTIVSPVDGVVLDRKVEEGETVVSSMNAVPVLTIAEDLKTVWVEATVPEADVGSIRVGQHVTFTADAYRRKFSGKVLQIRGGASETVNNVVTYPIIIEAENPEEMLFPGMTANISVETGRADNVPCVASAAFRFRPRPGDGSAAPALPDDPGGERRLRTLWTLSGGGALEPVAVETGLSDESYTELKDASLEGRMVAIGYEAAVSGGGADDTKNPFMPKMPQRDKNKGTAPSPKGGR